MTIPIGNHELNRRFQVMRPGTVADSSGGATAVFAEVGTVRAKVSQPTAQEQFEAQRAGATFAITVHLKPNADVRRGDRLVALDDGDDLRVKSTVTPSDPVYLRADCEQIQDEGGRS